MGMRYAIDVAFLDVGGRVLLARRGLVPGSLLGCRFAAGVLERPEGPGPWPCDGDLVELSELPGEIAPARAKGV